MSSQQPHRSLKPDRPLPIQRPVYLPPPPSSTPPPYPSRLDDAIYYVRTSRPAGYTRRAAHAASYPFRGIWYFLRNPALWPLFVGRLLPLSIISFLVYFILFAVAFLPQYAFLALFHGWGAWVNAVVLVLAEGLVIIQGLFEGFFVDECRVDVFDATLLDRGHAPLLFPHRVLHLDAPDPVKRLGQPTTPAAFQPWSLIQLTELVVFLPLNIIPYVGTPAFILITGSRLGKLCHHRWFVLRGLTKLEMKQEIRSKEWDYLWFGTVAMLLELVPVLSFLFLLTTSAGAALWVAKLEEDVDRGARGPLVGNQNPVLLQSGVEAPVLAGEYRDNPLDSVV